MVSNNKDKAQKGFTLIEVMLAITLAAIVIGLAVNFFSQGQLFYSKAQDKVDAQSQLRIALNQIKRELSVAESAEISGTPESYEAGYSYIYVEDNAVILNTIDDDGVSEVHQVCQPLPGLSILFSISSHDTNKEMLRIHMESEEGALIDSDILIQNISSKIEEVEPIGDSVIRFKQIKIE